MNVWYAGWVLDFLIENSGLSRSPGIHPANWSIGVYDGLIMWRRWHWLVPERSLYDVFYWSIPVLIPPCYLDFMKSTS